MDLPYFIAKQFHIGSTCVSSFLENLTICSFSCGLKTLGGIIKHRIQCVYCLWNVSDPPFLPLIGSEMEKPITVAYLHKEKQLSPNSAEEWASEKRQLCTELQSDACGDGTALGFKYLRSSVSVFIVTSVLAVLIAATDGPCLSRRVHRLWQSLPALPASPF